MASRKDSESSSRLNAEQPWAVGPRKWYLHGPAAVAPWLGFTAAIVTITSREGLRAADPGVFFYCAITSPVVLIAAILTLAKRDSHRLLGLGLCAAGATWMGLWCLAKLALCDWQYVPSGSRNAVLPALLGVASLAAAGWPVWLLRWDIRRTLTAKALLGPEEVETTSAARATNLAASAGEEWSAAPHKLTRHPRQLSVDQIAWMRRICMVPSIGWGALILVRLLIDDHTAMSEIGVTLFFLLIALWCVLLAAIWLKHPGYIAIGCGTHLLAALCGIAGAILMVFVGAMMALTSIHADKGLGLFWFLFGVVMGVCSYLTSHRAWYLVQLALKEALSMPHPSDKKARQEDADSELYGSGDWDEAHPSRPKGNGQT